MHIVVCSNLPSIWLLALKFEYEGRYILRLNFTYFTPFSPFNENCTYLIIPLRRTRENMLMIRKKEELEKMPKLKEAIIEFILEECSKTPKTASQLRKRIKRKFRVLVNGTVLLSLVRRLNKEGKLKLAYKVGRHKTRKKWVVDNGN